MRSTLLGLLALLMLAACQGNPTKDATPNPSPPNQSPTPNNPINPNPPAPQPPITNTGNWSDPATWGGSKPKAGEVATVRAGQRVILDENTPALAGLNVFGELVFADRDLELTTAYIMLHGRLQVGSEQAPYTRRGRITLTGAASSADQMGMGTKVIGVMDGGSLELYGENRVGWVKLNATAEAGATGLTLTQNPGWRVGDQIVVATTDFWDYGANRNEVRTIRSVSGNTLTLDRPLEYRHWGTLQTVAGISLDERASVGLLTRNLTIQGDAASEDGGFGGHVMAMRGGSLRLSGVELYRMGQMGRNGRYPVHWHLAGDSSGQFLRNASIWRSYNRCVTLHAADKLTLSGNVCYDFVGHGYFLEDGAESKNILENNLGIWAKPGRLLASDEQPAVFWVTNPDNTLRGNGAVASAGKGFWYALPDRPLNLSSSQPDRPRFTPLGVFENNFAHSNQSDGLHVDGRPNNDGTVEPGPRYQPRRNPAAPADDLSDIVPPVFRNFLAFKHQGLAIWYQADQIRIVNATLADNAAALDGANSSWFEQPSARKANFTGGLVAGFSANDEPDRRLNWFTGLSLYDGRIWVDGVTFANFPASRFPNSRAVNFDQNDQLAMLDMPLVTNSRFVNAVPFRYDQPGTEVHGSDYTQIHVDTDGSLSGQAGNYLVGQFYNYLLTPACIARPESLAYVCREPYIQQGLMLENQTSPETLGQVTLRRDDGVSYTTDDDNLVLIAGRSYALEWSRPATRVRLEYVRMRTGQSIRVSFPYPNANFKAIGTVNGWNDMRAAASLEEVWNGNGMLYFYDAATRRVSIKVMPHQEATTDRVTYLLEPR